MHRSRSTGAPAQGMYGASMGAPRAHAQHHAPSHAMPPPPASHATNKTQECHICLEDLRADLVACPCGHVYHSDCIEQALQVNKQCPICRGYASTGQLIRLFLEVPETNETSGGSTEMAPSSGHASQDPQVATLNERVGMLVERLQWQKKQHDLLVTEMKRARHQTEQLLVDKQTLLQRLGTLESNKNELLSKVAKYQIELSRQAEIARQMAVNQSIINYLNTCDADALEDEVQNPRELVAALKKACKFRHDQYQKVVKEKAKLNTMLQTLQQQQQQMGSSGGMLPFDDDRSMGKGKMKSPMESKRAYSAVDYTTPHPFEVKKRKINISPAGAASHPIHNLQAAPSSGASSASRSSSHVPRMEASGFRSSTYTDVPARPKVSSNTQRAQTIFARSSFNPNQYGAYNLTPSHEPPVQPSDHTVVRRGYDETGKLTNYYNPREPKRQSQASIHSHSTKSMQHGGHQYHGSSSSRGSMVPHGSAGGGNSSRPTSVPRQNYPLTNWLHKGQ